MDCSSPGSSVHGILQARILEWVSMPSSGGSSWRRNWTPISWAGTWILYCLSHQETHNTYWFINNDNTPHTDIVIISVAELFRSHIELIEPSRQAWHVTVVTPTLQRNRQMQEGLSARLRWPGSWAEAQPQQLSLRIHPSTGLWYITGFQIESHTPKTQPGDLPAVEWLRLCAPNAGALGSIPGQGAGPHMLQLETLHATTKTQHSHRNIFF